MKEVDCNCSKTGFVGAKIHLTGLSEWSNFAHQLHQAHKNFKDIYLTYHQSRCLFTWC